MNSDRNPAGKEGITAPQMALLALVGIAVGIKIER